MNSTSFISGSMTTSVEEIKQIAVLCCTKIKTILRPALGVHMATDLKSAVV